jgi:hypothetical protein
VSRGNTDDRRRKPIDFIQVWQCVSFGPEKMFLLLDRNPIWMTPAPPRQRGSVTTQNVKCAGVTLFWSRSGSARFVFILENTRMFISRNTSFGSCSRKAPTPSLKIASAILAEDDVTVTLSKGWLPSISPLTISPLSYILYGIVRKAILLFVLDALTPLRPINAQKDWGSRRHYSLLVLTAEAESVS